MVNVVVDKDKEKVSVEQNGFGIDILVESIIAVKAMYKAIKEKNDMAADVFEAIVKSMDFDFEDNDSDVAEQNIFEKLALMSERRLRDEE